MARVLWPAVALLSASAALGGNAIRITSPLYSFILVEPDQWRVDLQSAAQIAHFVLTPGGSPWRTSDLAIFGRFVPSERSETLEEFIEADESRFREGCPAPRVEDVDLELKGPREFTVRSFVCPGHQNDVVAVAQVPGHFAVFILSIQSDAGKKGGLEAFKEVLAGFQWLGGRSSPRSP